VSNNRSLRFFVVLLFAAAASASLVLADVGALGQNAAEDTTQSTGDVSGEQTDLSGTYTGMITMTGGHEMTGQGTLTITGNTFTMEMEGMSHSGRIYAVTTRGYTGAALYFTDMQDPRTNTPVVANVRARKMGDRLTLTPVPGTSTRLTFGTAARRGTRRTRRQAADPAMDANMNMNTNAATPPR
jgi:hypothetical protein